MGIDCEVYDANGRKSASIRRNNIYIGDAHVCSGRLPIRPHTGLFKYPDQGFHGLYNCELQCWYWSSLKTPLSLLLALPE